MIRLDIQLYCDECCDFEPDVTRPFKQLHKIEGTDDISTIQTDTVVRCRHAKRCESIKRYLDKRLEELR